VKNVRVCSIKFLTSNLRDFWGMVPIKFPILPLESGTNYFSVLPKKIQKMCQGLKFTLYIMSFM
jgi:hypothetical protein